MANEWQVYRLGDIVDIFDGPHATPSKIDAGPIFLGISNLENGRLDLSSTAHLSEEDYVKWTRRVTPQEGDIVFSYETRLGEAAIIPAELKCCLGRRMGLLRIRSNQVDSRFLLYTYLGDEFQGIIRSRTVHGSTVDRIPLIEMPDFPIRLPSPETQRAIAHILGALDDKIELNRQMNQTLEDIARALFKSWFVDFDPVRAKAAGEQPPDLAPHIADLFPDELVESELGEIPKGWEVCAVSELAQINEQSLGKNDLLDLIDYIEISEVMRGEISEIARYRRGTEPSRARRRLQHGDTVISTVRPDRGAHFLCLAPPETLIASTGFAVLSPKDNNWAFLYTALTRREVGETLGRLADGGAYPAIRPEVVGNLMVVVPGDSQLQRVFESITEPLYQKAAYNREQSRTLAALRDTLLPKLISGELRVPEGFLQD